MKTILSGQCVSDVKRSSQNNSGAEPTITGSVCVHQQGPGGRMMKVRLIGKVYVSNIRQYMVFYQDKKYSKACAYVNLKNCSVQLSDDVTLNVISKDCDGTSLTLSLPDKQEAQRWIDALKHKDSQTPSKGLSSPARSNSGLMPMLEENEEEE